GRQPGPAGLGPHRRHGPDAGGIAAASCLHAGRALAPGLRLSRRRAAGARPHARAARLVCAGARRPGAGARAMTWERVMPLTDLWLGELRGCRVAGHRVLLLRVESGVYAYEDRCAHLGLPLSDGTLR